MLHDILFLFFSFCHLLLLYALVIATLATLKIEIDVID